MIGEITAKIPEMNKNEQKETKGNPQIFLTANNTEGEE
jgi:hypothetical protein